MVMLRDAVVQECIQFLEHCEGEQHSHTHTQVLVSLHFYWLMYQSFSGSDALWVMRALGFEKQATVGLTMDSLKPNDKNRSKGTRNITFFTPHILLSFQNLVPTLLRMHLSH